MKKKVKGFKTLSGKHCITTALRHLYKYNGSDLSEEMIFGLGAGLSFIYVENKNMPFPIIGGRVKIGELEDNLESATGAEFTQKKTSSQKKAYDELKRYIDNNIPVMVYADMGMLDYLHMPEGAHFGGHALVVFGIDEDQGVAFISDRDSRNKKITPFPDEKSSDFHKVSLKQLAAARSSKYKPFPAENKYLVLRMKQNGKPAREDFIDAVGKCADGILNPPVKIIGLRGIKHFSEKVIDWGLFSKSKLKNAAINTFFMIDEIGGTGGGAFRKMYGDFLKQGSVKFGLPEFGKPALHFYKAAEEWDKAAAMFKVLSKTADTSLLAGISDTIGSAMQYELDGWNIIKKILEAGE